IDRAAVALDDPEYRREPEAGAALGPLRLRREVRLEHALAELGRDPRTIVLDLENDQASGLGHRVAGPDHDAAITIDGIARVDHEVHHDLLELRPIADHRAALARLELE